VLLFLQKKNTLKKEFLTAWLMSSRARSCQQESGGRNGGFGSRIGLLIGWRDCCCTHHSWVLQLLASVIFVGTGNAISTDAPPQCSLKGPSAGNLFVVRWFWLQCWIHKREEGVDWSPLHPVSTRIGSAFRGFAWACFWAMGLTCERPPKLLAALMTGAVCRVLRPLPPPPACWFMVLRTRSG